jgi:hypothetical protein
LGLVWRIEINIGFLASGLRNQDGDIWQTVNSFHSVLLPSEELGWEEIGLAVTLGVPLLDTEAPVFFTLWH